MVGPVRSLSVGRRLVRLIRLVPVYREWQISIRLGPGCRFASVIAARKVQPDAPLQFPSPGALSGLSPVEVTVKGAWAASRCGTALADPSGFPGDRSEPPCKLEALGSLQLAGAHLHVGDVDAAIMIDVCHGGVMTRVVVQPGDLPLHRQIHEIAIRDSSVNVIITARLRRHLSTSGLPPMSARRGHRVLMNAYLYGGGRVVQPGRHGAARCMYQPHACYADLEISAPKRKQDESAPAY